MQLLIVSMAVLIFVLTVLSVLATMTALAMERRVDVGIDEGAGWIDWADCRRCSWRKLACWELPEEWWDI